MDNKQIKSFLILLYPWASAMVFFYILDYFYLGQKINYAFLTIPFFFLLFLTLFKNRLSKKLNHRKELIISQCLLFCPWALTFSMLPSPINVLSFIFCFILLIVNSIRIFYGKNFLIISFSYITTFSFGSFLLGESIFFEPVLSVLMVIFTTFLCHFFLQKNNHIIKLLQIKVEKAIEIKKDLSLANLETSLLLNSLKKSIFTIDKTLTILSPISTYSEVMFGRKIKGESVLNILYPNSKGKSLENLKFKFQIPFGFGQDQFFYGQENLPKKLCISPPREEKEKVISITYISVPDDDENTARIMFIIENITEFDKDYSANQRGNLNYRFLLELVQVKNKKETIKLLNNFLTPSFEILEDFASPVSSSYEMNYFRKKILENIKLIEDLDPELLSLHLIITGITEKLNSWGHASDDYDFQLAAVENMTYIIEDILRYLEVYSQVFPHDEFHYSNKAIHDLINEKINNLKKIFTNNLFTYVQGLDLIDKNHNPHIEQMIKLYPEFDQTIKILYQRTKLISFLLKVTSHNELSDFFKDMSKKLKKIPKKDKFNLDSLKNNLVIPYKEMVKKTGRNI
jgi:hypothetical protein